MGCCGCAPRLGSVGSDSGLRVSGKTRLADCLGADCGPGSDARAAARLRSRSNPARRTLGLLLDCQCAPRSVIPDARR
eukprot:137417-Chlamydomonas_euryale.AAC.3